MGVETADYAEIVSGLHEGEKIVTSDRSGLKAGEVVRPQAMNLIQYQSDNNKQ
jgi:hypothetical protein